MESNKMFKLVEMPNDLKNLNRIPEIIHKNSD